MSVEMWGIVFGLASTGFIIGGLLVAKFGLGRNPIRTLLLAVAMMGLLGAVFTIREWAWLYVLGIWLYMMLIPAAEASEQTVIQKVVPFRRQGRVFGFARCSRRQRPHHGFPDCPAGRIPDHPVHEIGAG
ncbi:hypothetical protein [Arthrobacter sp. JCM 19049]|uniref:hypothetical protein n=1 Tax=Arthrobacter sp. JCM 19049 TaxID=1460643 RepID=UPI000ACA56DB|nr:hypothetical protein [Arthrobacter sp. JCM 19049]